MTDPYKILGVSPTASDEEVKKAYLELARKYHPDNYSGSDLADLAEEKMKQVNEAYETVKRMRATGASSSSNGSADGQSGSSYGGSLYEARRLISLGNYSNAELILDSMSQSDRNAEWFFLKACILMKRGSYFDARRHLDEACRLDPSNAEYAQARRSMDGASVFGGETVRNADGGMCDVCTSLLCADCLCECMGGDLIPCC